MRPLGVGVALCALGHALPNPDRVPAKQERGLLGGVLGEVTEDVDHVVSGLLDQLHDAVQDGDKDGVLNVLSQLRPTQTIDTVEEGVAALQGIVDARPSNIVDWQGQMIAKGLISGTVSDLLDFVEGFADGMNGHENRNPDPAKSVYPKMMSCDASYSQAESALRSAIYIPKTFTYGTKPPVVLFPGTGASGYSSFVGNFIPLLSDVDWADPVWVNVPGNLNGDAQVNAEFAAYAMNYIAALTETKVAVIAWSQGNIDVQWAFKYWPSTRDVTTDHVAISADYQGSTMANLADLTGITNVPSILQQEAGSNFIKALRADNGDSAYVPTTSVYSGFFDEIVQPQSGPEASAFLGDVRGVGVTNAEVQVICEKQPAGSLYTHESLLANPLTFALAKDALTHEGPGKPDRIDLDDICGRFLADGLELGDFLLTENALLYAVTSVVLYEPKVGPNEPVLMDYATRAPQSC